MKDFRHPMMFRAAFDYNLKHYVSDVVPTNAVHSVVIG